MEINQNELNIEREKLSRNYEYCKVSYAGEKFDNVALLNNNICVLPFETEATGKAINALYLSKYYDFLKAKNKVSAMLYRNIEDKDESNLDTVIRCIGDSMKIPIGDADIKRVFYLGEIELNNLVSGCIPCYGVNVTGMVKQDVSQYPVNDTLGITLEKFPYVTVLRGTTQDYLVASAVFMLLSYLS